MPRRLRRRVTGQCGEAMEPSHWNDVGQFSRCKAHGVAGEAPKGRLRHARGEALGSDAQRIEPREGGSIRSANCDATASYGPAALPDRRSVNPAPPPEVA